MGEKRYEEVADDVERLYWDHTANEIWDMLNIGGSTYQRAIEYAGLPDKTTENRLEHRYGVPADWLLDTLHNVLEKSVNQMGKELPVGRVGVTNAMERLDVNRRGQAEAERVKWSNMTDEQREQQVSAAHQRTRELAENGNHNLHDWWNENPKRAQEIAEKAAELGAAGRESNGMAGVTGQDHPRWTGGKNIYDAVKRQLPRSWSTAREDTREAAGHQCENCGGGLDGRGLDVHHIVPVMAGGTNHPENRMALCPSCHGKSERFTAPLFDAVLAE